MDIATVIGIVGGLGLIFVAIGAEQIIYFVSVPSLLIVVGGAGAAIMVNYPMSDVIAMIGVLKNTLLYKAVSPKEVIPKLVDYASTARRDGILALQSVTADISDPFMSKGIQLAIDGAEPQVIMKILETEVEYIKERHRIGADMALTFGTFLPAFGMIGTLVGLVLMLQKLDDPSTIGPSMAIALITTFYGALLANLVFLPMAGKLKKRSSDEVMIKELMTEGIVSIATGDNPRIIEQKLHVFLLPKLRESQFD
ncbi:Flagellar motor rotation protein MotA [hydrothermal vent metagenome]|uniref:Flagellar motor rotation protein MotA n=1 Tax=hydrothermal vent metagenome TaxID=652676 RepID=A0A3B1C2N0_9ZZZZ